MKDFDESKMWASQAAAYSGHTKQAALTSDANLQTLEGRQYDSLIAKEFPKKFTEAVKQCVDSAGEDLGGFDLFLRVGQTGMVKESLLQPSTTVGGCLVSRVQFSTLSPPPKPDFWIKISMNIGP